MDFMGDSLKDDRSVRTFNLIDDCNRECLTIGMDFSLPTQRVIRSLERIIERRGKPSARRCNNGPEYISQDLIEWANQEQIRLRFIPPGKST